MATLKRMPILSPRLRFSNALNGDTVSGHNGQRRLLRLCVRRNSLRPGLSSLLVPLRKNWRNHWAASYLQGRPICLPSLLAAGRYQDLLDLLQKPLLFGGISPVEVQALATMGAAWKTR
jgi:hypothetical protein